jgi:hypothetical protein
MKTILALAAVLFSWPAPAQNNCNVELKPLKPITPIGCADTAPACFCNPSGTNCHWTWACVSSGNTSEEPKRSGIDSSIPLRGRPLQMSDPMDAYRKALEIRDLELQGRITQQQIEAQKIRNLQLQDEITRQQYGAKPILLPTQLAPVITGTPSPLASAPVTTFGVSNGRLWKMMDAGTKPVWLRAYLDGLMEAFLLDGSDQKTILTRTQSVTPGTLTYAETITAVDRFYESAENAPIPIATALQVVGLKALGVGQSYIDGFIANMRKDAAQ